MKLTFHGRPCTRLVLVLLLIASALSQTDSAYPGGRTYPYSVERVNRALQQLGAFDGGRLPMLDGFVSAETAQLDRYERPYYQYRIELSPVDADHTVVKVAARISAWYSDANPANSQYRSLSSKGRLEADLFDRLQDALMVRSARKASPGAELEKSHPAKTQPGQTKVEQLSSPRTNTSASIPVSAATESTYKTSDPAAPLDQQLDSILAERRVVAERTNALLAEIKGLESARESPAPAPPLAAVRRSGAGVMTRMSDGGPVLFRAQAEDEFEVVEKQGDWTRVRLGHDSTGWIQTAELDLPTTQVKVAPVVAESMPPKSPELGFWISHEDVNLFSGDWARLKGKRVLFVYAQPRGLIADLASGDRKLNYAKRVFAERYRNAGHAKTVFDGVVVIFMGAKGGIAAATLADIQQWVEGNLGDEAFVNRCSLDPPAEFRLLGTP